MSISNQKRRELQAAGAKLKAEPEQAKLLAGLKNRTIIAVDKTKVRSRSVLPTIPEYYYDTLFTCKDCGKQELWTARQQQVWHEAQGGEIEAIAVRCRACRRKEKLRRETARKIHLEGM